MLFLLFWVQDFARGADWLLPEIEHGIRLKKLLVQTPQFFGPALGASEDLQQLLTLVEEAPISTCPAVRHTEERPLSYGTRLRMRISYESFFARVFRADLMIQKYARPGNFEKPTNGLSEFIRHLAYVFRDQMYRKVAGQARCDLEWLDPHHLVKAVNDMASLTGVSTLSAVAGMLNSPEQQIQIARSIDFLKQSQLRVELLSPYIRSQLQSQRFKQTLDPSHHTAVLDERLDGAILSRRIQDNGVEPVVRFSAPLSRKKILRAKEDAANNGQVSISSEAIKTVRAELEPGDIGAIRIDFLGTNYFLPGFWGHLFLYIGTPAEADRYFEQDVNPFFASICKKNRLDCSGFVEYVRDQFPKAYSRWIVGKFQDRYPMDTIEAKGLGVQINSIQQSARTDYLAVLRPKASKVEKAMAILRAMETWGRRFDFEVDLRGDAQIACTELVTKSYQNPVPNFELDVHRYIEYRTVIGAFPRPLLTVDGFMHKWLDDFRSGVSQLEFVLFLDRNDKNGRIGTRRGNRDDLARSVDRYRFEFLN